MDPRRCSDTERDSCRIPHLLFSRGGHTSRLVCQVELPRANDAADSCLASIRSALWWLQLVSRRHYSLPPSLFLTFTALSASESERPPHRHNENLPDVSELPRGGKISAVISGVKTPNRSVNQRLSVIVTSIINQHDCSFLEYFKGY